MFRAERKFFICMVLLVAASCSSGPTPPRMGTPPFYWQAAIETFAAGDYLKAGDHLDELLKGSHEFTLRAQPWALVVHRGLAAGYLDLADSFEAGTRSNKANPTALRRQMNDYRARAGRHGLQFAEAFLAFQRANKEPKVEFAFGFPKGTVTPAPELAKVGGGALLAAPEQERAERRAIERGVLLAACEAVGAREDSAKAQEILRGGSVPREIFLAAMAEAINEVAGIYGATKLNQPDKEKLFREMALEAAKAMSAGADSKKLIQKIEAAIKKSRRG